jgi:hypothetical protein
MLNEACGILKRASASGARSDVLADGSWSADGRFTGGASSGSEFVARVVGANLMARDQTGRCFDSRGGNFLLAGIGFSE